MRAANSELTTAQLGERTGLSAGTLRMWESRHGFPEPARLPGGHRRYAPGDVDRVREILRWREQGLSLPAAIERVRSRPAPVAASVFAGLRARRPDVAPTLLAKPALLALSRAIEDEYCAQAAGGVLLGSFQREPFYRSAQRRWREMARTADLAVALADFPGPAEDGDGPVEVPIARRHALAREWSVIVSAGTVQACLAAWELPSDRETPDAGRRFEVVWSVEPEVVADAVEVAEQLLAPLDADVARRLRTAHDGAHADPDPEPALHYAGALAHRMVGYLGQMVSGTGEPRRDVRG